MRMQKRPRTVSKVVTTVVKRAGVPKRAGTGAARQAKRASNRAKVFFCTLLSFSLRFFMFTAFIYYNVFFY